MKKFTIEEIRSYIISCDSLGDVLHKLSEQAIEEANKPIDENSEAYLEGVEEYRKNAKCRNPYDSDSHEYKEYAAGWFSVSEDF